MDGLKDPNELEKQNRQAIIRNLNDVYSSIEKLIQKTYQNKETDLNFQLRNIRSSVSQLLADIKNKDLDSFSGKKGTLEEFYRIEDTLLAESAKMNDIFASTIKSDSIDIFSLDDMVESFKKAFNERINVDKDILNEFKLKQMEASSAERVMSRDKKIPEKKEIKKTEHESISLTYGRSGNATKPEPTISSSSVNKEVLEEQQKDNVKKEIDTEILSKLYNYMNILEKKYSNHQPEVSFDGEYIGDKKWKVEISDKYISGTIFRKMVLNAILFETYWKPFDNLRTIMEFVQKKATTVPAGQYKSLCIVNSDWNADIKDWAENYIHPRLVLYLYDISSNEIIYNESVFNADRIKLWHNPDTYKTIESEILPLIDREEPFDDTEVAELTGLSIEGAKKFLAVMVAENKIVDVGFGKSQYTGLRKE
ncbi:hypothetical protein [Methanolobus vulcani]|uniref:Uncharacterized protein n=1 Tax=Methanolobus vulcani TaxID=38026 RepID=A0A7Z8KM51_9EURY|nr:hypothetical protein [Methanolobus vulcani]TQD23492.1 hypothetical protein FKV42_13275 [Methanolobus vulcani]